MKRVFDIEPNLLRRPVEFVGMCSQCRDSGPCRHCDRGQVESDEEITRLAQQWIERTGLGQRYLDHTLATYPYESAAWQAVRLFVSNWDERTNLVLSGPVGVGKTGLLASALQAVRPQLMSEGQSAMFYSVPDLLQHIRDGVSHDDYGKRIERTKRVRLLILDDIGTERLTAWAQEALYAIVNARYSAHLPIWASTNLSLLSGDPSAFSKHVTPRIADRLTEGATLVNVTGPNLRRQA